MVLVCGCGFGVMDYLYTGIDYSSPAFKKYMSKKRGDGGIRPGQLCLVEAWEKYTGTSLEQIRKEQGWDREPDKYNVGGPSIVALINAAQMLNTRGTKVRYYGALANDSTATRMMNITKQTPLDTTHLKIHNKGTSPFAVCLSDPNYNNGVGERSFTVNIGVYDTVPANEIIDDSFFEGDVLFFGATALTPSIHGKLTSLLRRGKELNKLNIVATIFDHISEATNPGKRWSMGESDESFKYMDLLMVDWDEAMGISGKTTIKDAVQFFQKMGVKTLIVTHGPEDIYAYSDGTVFKKMPLRSFPISAAVSRDLTEEARKKGDSTGCGDNFSGGVMTYIAEALDSGKALGQLDLVQAIAWGCACGGFTCFILGGTYIEKHPGEKRKKVEYYRREYLRQIGYSKL